MKFLGWYEKPETLYIAMEYLSEGGLAKHIGSPLLQETIPARLGILIMTTPTIPPPAMAKFSENTKELVAEVPAGQLITIITIPTIPPLAIARSSQNTKETRPRIPIITGPTLPSVNLSRLLRKVLQQLQHLYRTTLSDLKSLKFEK